MTRLQRKTQRPEARPAEGGYLHLLTGMPLHFFGGCEQAERKMCLWLPDYLDESWLSSGDGPCAAVRAEFFAESSVRGSSQSVSFVRPAEVRFCRT